MHIDQLISLMTTADPSKRMSVSIINGTQLGLGVHPFQPTHLIDLAEEKLIIIGNPSTDDTSPRDRPPPIAEPAQRLSRQTGRYLLGVRGETIVCISLKDMLSQGLQKLEEMKPGTLAKLEGVKPRTKRIVSRDPAKLFEDEVLKEKYAEKLTNGWWYGTNNSAAETQTWLRRGCELAGLIWGKDLSTSL